MRDYTFNHQDLFNFSNSNPYEFVDKQYIELFEELNYLKTDLNFPAIHNDIGSFISFMMPFWNPQVIFEMGSGYGHSAFWYLLGNTPNLSKVILTEKRSDLQDKFNTLSWPENWKTKLEYHNADAFDVLDQNDTIDFALIDGVKGDYLKFLKKIETKISTNGIVLIDNSYWRGSFLDKELRSNKQSAKNIFELHEYIKSSKVWKSIFIPYLDGVTLLTLS